MLRAGFNKVGGLFKGAVMEGVVIDGVTGAVVTYQS
jgi:hypothetical protein